MRRLLASALLVLTLAAPVSAAEPPRIVIDNTYLSIPSEQAPFIESGRTMVPMRAMFEALGADVSWNQATQTVTAVKGETSVTLQIGSDTAAVSGKAVHLDQPAALVNDRTFVPLRFVSEALDAQVTWLEERRTVAITTRPVAEGPVPFRATSAPGALQRLSLAPGAAVIAEGDSIYFLNLETGAIEGWAVPGAQRNTVGYGASADGRLVIASSADTGWVVDRTSGAIHQWDRYQQDLVAANATYLLFEETRPDPGTVYGYDAAHGIISGHLRGSGRYTVVRTENLEPVNSFTLPGVTGGITEPDGALFSPDGSRIFLSRDDQSYLVDAASGRQLQVLGSGRFMPVKGGTEVVGIFETPRDKRVRRLNWQGDILAEATIEAQFIKVSPDGEWVAWEVVMADFTPTVFYARLSEAHNPNRALGASMCYGSVGLGGNRWLGDGLVVFTKQGMRILTRDGQAVETPALSNAQRLDLVPGPGSDDRLSFRQWDERGYFVGARDAGGNVLAQVSIKSADGSLLPHRAFDLWGATADEIRFAVRTHYGSGGPCGDYAMPLPVKVEKAGTFDWHLKLQVTGTGSCLNVRTEPSLSAPAVTCLKDGTVIDLGNDAAWNTQPSFIHNHDGQWFHLDDGWILVSSGYVQFAE